jgi:dTDP-4-amino-4,6-dideoxygalactose transaminase
VQIPLFKIYSDEKDLQSVNSVIKSGMYWAIGSSVSKFEKQLSQYIGSKYCGTFNSGTSALHALMLAYNFKSGDEVIVPSLTFIATANAPLFVQAKPIFADIELESLALDPDHVQEKITSKTKAIIPIHYGGNVAQIIALKEIAEDNNLVLIEDAAESLGAKVDGRMIGSFGDSSLLSFCQNKIISTGEGGAIVTNSKEIHDKLVLLRSHGRLDDQDYFSSAISGDYITLGFNFRLSNIQAALGLSQLEKIEDIISKRLEVAHKYITELKSIDEIILPNIPSNGKHVFQMFSIRVKHGFRDELIDFLKSRGISSKVYFSPVHLTHFYQNVLKYKVNLPITEMVSKDVLSIPMYPTMTEKEQQYVVDAIKNFFEEKRS